ncbi:ABC transporter permease [Paenibacillus soyae]|uniref:Transport permease protein n=1 Tax=Paenibacillus soyae TaxID=2969249 RepID=A0A9X2MU70_9BACL|nr:ABC transporter permease [Paenibacillus soyae]MCR2806575.1 ABC transporter permease [Paenibacillus soyae]
MMVIAKRNLKLFFRDRTGVLMSFLSVFIILGLYVLFLGDTMKSNLPDAPEADFLLNSWVMAGILAVTTVTATLGAFGVMVEDRTRKLLKDFTAAPVKRQEIVGGYILSACSVGIILSIVTLLLAEVYIVANGGGLLSAVTFAQVIGILVLSVLAGGSIVFFITSLLRSHSAYTTASTIIGTLIGFLTGIYIPIGSLPEAVQWVIKLFPVSHAGAMLRTVMVEEPMTQAFAGAPEEALREFKLHMGVVFDFGGKLSTMGASIAVLAGTTVFFYLLSIMLMVRNNK